MKIQQQFSQAGISFASQESMAKHTTFQTGGAVSFLLCVHSLSQLKQALSILKAQNMPWFVLGCGSNLLVSDAGFSGAAIKLCGEFQSIEYQGQMVSAGAGVRLATLVSDCLAHGLTGLEFAGGIPGSVGGGVYMNAGAYGGDLSQFLVSARLLSPKGEILVLSKEELGLSYRKSILMVQPLILLSATFSLLNGDVAQAKLHLKDFNARRREKQPLQFPSAGSTFRRPEGHFAGALIEQAGLKGFQLGGAQVSQKHAGFIVNVDHATSMDIYHLIQYVQQKVQQQSGILLQPEVRMIGSFEGE